MTKIASFRRLFLLNGVAALIALTSDSAQAQFRVETDIFLEDVGKPVSQTVTRFFEGVAYDESRDKGQDITMVDPKRDRIIRFNEAKEIMTVVNISQLTELLRLAKVQAKGGNLAVFLQGAEKVDVSDTEITVGDDPLVYKTTLQKHEDSEIATTAAAVYRQFADATKLLNAFSGRGDPPFARLVLNEHVQKANALPKQIYLTSNRGGKDNKLKCVVHVDWMLSKRDRSRITEIQEMISDYTQVDAAKYNELTNPVKVAQQDSTLIPSGSR